MHELFLKEKRIEKKRCKQIKKQNQKEVEINKNKKTKKMLNA